MNQLVRIQGFLTLCICFSLVGCGSSQTANPKPLAQSLGKLQDISGEIIEAFKAGTPNQAHDQLHVVGGLLSALPKQAMQAGLAATDIATIKESATGLMDSFGQLDKTLHSDTDVELDLDGISEQINNGIKSIIDKLPEGAMESFGHAGHDHGGEGHAEHDGHDEDGEDHDEGHDDHQGHDEDGDDHDEGHDDHQGHDEDGEDHSEEK